MNYYVITKQHRQVWKGTRSTQRKKKQGEKKIKMQRRGFTFFNELIVASSCHSTFMSLNFCLYCNIYVVCCALYTSQAAPSTQSQQVGSYFDLAAKKDIFMLI